ncbi:MAG TPA: hypothetical protein VFI03_05325 [Solirubrobacterales bacterium]|nr:hypothetical protein [Solirubrobacterales bacterium]
MVPRLFATASFFASLALLVCTGFTALAVVPPERASAAAVATGQRLHRPATASSTHFRFFSPTSFWNTPLVDDEGLDPASARLTRALASEVKAEQADRVGPWLSTTRYSVPIYTVGPEQPTVRVRLTSPIHSPALQAAFEQVPLPPEATPSGGTDGHLVVWQPASDRLWEFWRLVRGPEGPEASWGGAMRDVSSNPGVYGDEAWPNAESWWGASASSLPIAGGLITLEDLRLGEINHALALALPEIRAGVYASPARRSDGKSANRLALPEGAHLRLDPKLDLDSLRLPRTTRLIAEAAQRYGLFVRDGSSVVQLFAQDPVSAPKNPYVGAGGYLEGKYPNELLASFPWENLQLLKMELHSDR